MLCIIYICMHIYKEHGESIQCYSCVYVFRTNQLGLDSCHELNVNGKDRVIHLNIWIPVGGPFRKDYEP